MKINAQADKAEVLIYEDIGAGWGLTAKQFASEIKALGKLREINVRMNSAGGNVFDGIAIYNTLVRNPARVTVDIDGLAASIASVIAMAGDEIRIADNGMMMIHDPWIVTGGTAEDLRSTAKTLDQVRDQLIDTYVKRTGQDSELIGGLMSDETWMDAETAKSLGFADEITGELAIAAKVDWSKYGYKHVPKQLSNMVISLPSSKETRAKCARIAMRAKRHR